MSKIYLVLLLSLVLLVLTGCSEDQANSGEPLLLSGQTNQTDFWSEYPENWENGISHPRMLVKNTK
ncbi:MAG: hypothetical protein FVQ82_14460 [Planctomycetes bacterium]|nr:hypothetical protein [Planctomycetota bacterium]